MAFREAFQALPNDFFTYALPFLLVFAIIFGLVQALGIFGKKNKPVGAIIGFVVAMYFLRAGQLGQLAEMFSAMSRDVMLLLLVGLILMLALAMGNVANGELFGIPVIALLLLLGALALLALPLLGMLEVAGIPFIGSIDTATLVAVLIGLALLAWLIINGEEE